MDNANPPAPGSEAEEAGGSDVDAEAWLAGLDRVGWRFGLDRIRRLCDVLGLPQNRFASIHVVGSNGKSSVAKMTAALLEAEGLSTGTYLSPHLERWSERIRIGLEEIPPDRFEQAVARTRETVEIVERGLEPGERVTQFEAATAAAFVALEAAGVDVGVIEAGLGGRLDATNVIPSRVAVLTSVSLEHTDLLGETEAEIAAEKLAVLRDHSALVVGRVSDTVARIAAAVAAERSAELISVPDAAAAGSEAPVLGYQRRNLAVSLAAAEAFLGRAPGPAAVDLAASIGFPARLELVEGDPPVVFDAAHNREGLEAVVESLPELTGGRPAVAVLGALADKPLDRVVPPVASACASVVCTEIPATSLEGVGRPGASAHTAAALARACEQAGGRAETVPQPDRALGRARELALELDGVVLVTGSFYLVSALRG